MVDGNRAGFIEGYIFPESTDSVVISIAILSQYRRYGIAKELARHIECISKAMNIKYIIMRAYADNAKSISLAKNLGYNLVKSSSTQVRFEKVLESFIGKEDKHMSNFDAFITDMKNTAALEAIFFSTEKSQGRKIENFATIDKAIGAHIKMLEEFQLLATKYTRDLAVKPNTEVDQRPIGEKFYHECVAIDYARGSEQELRKMGKAYVRNNRRILDRADMKKDSVRDAESALIEKLEANGEYTKRLEKIRIYMSNLAPKIKDMINRYSGELYRLRGVNTLAREYNWFANQYNLIQNDAKVTSKISYKAGYTPKNDETHEDD